MNNSTVSFEQWQIDKLMQKLSTNELSKPKFQRKKMWLIEPDEDNVNIPNEKKYIEFMCDIKNSVHSITLSKNLNNTFINIDGNNRINAIHHYMTKPFEIFINYLDGLENFIVEHGLREIYIDDEFLNDECKGKLFSVGQELFNTIYELSYRDIVDSSVRNIFINNKFYGQYLKDYRDSLDDIIENIKNKLKINNGKERFDTTVKINVCIFEGCSITELCSTFESINRYSNKLTENELLACVLCEKDNFDITDKNLEKQIKQFVKQYYDNKNENEILQCYTFDQNNKLNAFDFIVGFQNYCSNKFQNYYIAKFGNKENKENNSKLNIIEQFSNDGGLSLFFKLYKLLVISNENFKFNSKNVNEFIENILYGIDILMQVYDKIYNQHIKLFNNMAENKINTFRKAHIMILLSAIIGHKKLNIQWNIVNAIEKVILYHLFMNDVKHKIDRDNFKDVDKINYPSGGIVIEVDEDAKNIYNNPQIIVENITKEKFTDLLAVLVQPKNKGDDEKKTRKSRKFFEKILLIYYYKNKVPTKFLTKSFNIEHICPYSSKWNNEIDINRLGNIFPILNEINLKRSNKHICRYSESNHSDFINFMDVIPQHVNYNKIIKHEQKNTIIINNKLYNDLCEKNEENYISNFINTIFIN